MIDRQMKFLDLESFTFGNMDDLIGIFFGRAMTGSGQQNGGNLFRPSHLEKIADVDCIPGSADAKNHIAGTSENEKLLGEDEIRIDIVHESSIERRMGEQRNAAQSHLEMIDESLVAGSAQNPSGRLVIDRTAKPEPLHQFADDMLRIGSAAAISRTKKDSVIDKTGFECYIYLIDAFGSIGKLRKTGHKFFDMPFGCDVSKHVDNPVK